MYVNGPTNTNQTALNSKHLAALEDTSIQEDRHLSLLQSQTDVSTRIYKVNPLGFGRAVNFMCSEPVSPSRNCCLVLLMSLSKHSNLAGKELILCS